MVTPFADALPPRPPFPPWPAEPPGRPGHPPRPGQPEHPGPSPQPPGPAVNPALQPVRVWFDPAGWPGNLYERLLARRIVIATGYLDGEAATALGAQLLTLDAEGTGPIMLELQGLAAELPAVLSVMGILDVVRAPVSAYAGGRIRGAALGILASASHRWAYPNSLFVLAEPEVSFEGTVTDLAAREEQARVMLGELFSRLAEVTGRDLDEIRGDARRERLFTVDDAIAYGLVEGRAEPRPSPRPGPMGLAGGG
jgi:ATP-dependent Clp protease, protease subunit